LRSEVVRHVQVAIAGSGFGGLGTAIRLKQSGVDDFLIFEREGRVGGVWRDNSYPGCACDVPSHLYSFSFAKNPDWTRSFSPQGEIWEYLEGCAERFGVVPHVRFHHGVLDAAWDDQAQRWRLETTGGLYTADLFVAAVGALAEPSTPKLAGLKDFAGKVFHSARWDHRYELEGKTVLVVGTGASAIQFVPAIQPKVKKLSLFQRTPPWVMPRRDRPIRSFERAALRTVPGLQSLLRGALYGARELTVPMFMHPTLARAMERLARMHLSRAVKDPALRAKLTPSYTLGCKRILLSNDYYPAVQQPNVDIVTEAIERVTPKGILTADGMEHPADAIIFGTGFQIQEYPFGKHVHGRGGQTLAERWRTTMTAHLGTTVAGFPNLFLLLGPNTGLGHSSVIVMIEAQIEHVVRALQYMRATGATSIEPRAEAQAAFVAEVDSRMRGTVWTAGGCKSWYLDQQGRNSTLWPGTTLSFRRRVASFRPRDYTTTQGDPVLPELEEWRGEGAKFRFGRTMMKLPARVQVRLSGGSPVRVEGQTLDPGLQLLVAISKRTDGAWPPEAAEYRRLRNRDSVAISGPKTPVHFTRDFSIAGPSGPLRLRHYATDQANAPLVVYLHGGGMVFGDLETHDGTCRLLCRHGAVHVLAVDYRLAPEHPFPAALLDSQAAFKWATGHAAELGADSSRVGVGGDSAGGNLAAVVSLLARQEGVPAPACQLLIYPAVDRSRAHPSIDSLAEGFLLTRAAIEWFHAQYTGSSGVDSADPRISPLLADDLRGLPPALVVSAAFDPLRDEGEAYANALRVAGNDVVLRRFDGFIHGFVNLTGIHAPSRDAVIEIARATRTLFDTANKMSTKVQPEVLAQ
jgi:cation diffusion facilitator CzcD-associated flavoprotein CzcO/acetyl esterase/lipase